MVARLQKESPKIQAGHFYHFNRVDLPGSASGSASGSLIPTLISVIISSWQKKRSQTRVGLAKPNKLQKRKNVGYEPQRSENSKMEGRKDG